MTGNFDPSELERQLQQRIADIRKGAVKGLAAAAEHVLGEAIKLVPIEEGTLQNSGTTAVDAENLRAGIGFGLGAAAPYALVQHEDMSLHHDPGRQAKYLEVPLVAAKADIGKIIAREIKAAT